jgi:plastocyanin
VNLRGVVLRFMSLGLLVTVGCATHPPFPESSRSGRVVEVQVGETLAPAEVTVKEGDEVRWINTTSATVDVYFEKSLDGVVSCQKGFVSAGWGYLFRTLQLHFLVIARVHNNNASLCFSAPGTYAYTLRMDQAATGKSSRTIGTVTIE